MSDFEKMLRETLAMKEFNPSTIEKVKWVLLDTFASVLYGIKTEKPLKSYIERLNNFNQAKGDFIPIIGTNKVASIKDSIIIHGASVVSNELDEGNSFAKGHPSAHIFPSIYTSAYINQSSGKEFIRAFIIGYEASSRLAYASNMRDNMHPHGTWGNVGGTIAAGILANQSIDDIVEAAKLTLTLPIATTWEAAEKGVSARNLYTGIGSFIAYQSLELQNAGFNSTSHVVQDVWGNIMSDDFNEDKLFEGFLEPPLIERNYFKYYPSCRFTHAALDALKIILERVEISISDIEGIQVDTYSLAARCKALTPRTPLEAKFSIPFVLSLMLHGKNLFKSHENELLFDSSIRSLSSKIIVDEDPEFTKLLPNQRPARVTLFFNNRRSEHATVYTAKGEHDLPFSEAKLEEKYRYMLSDYYSDHLVSNLKHEVFHLDTYSNFREWLSNASISKGGPYA